MIGSALPARATVEEVRVATHAHPLVGPGSAVGAHSSWDRCPRLVLLTLCAMLRTSSAAAPPFLLRVPAIVAENSLEHVLGTLRGPIFLRVCVCFHSDMREAVQRAGLESQQWTSNVSKAEYVTRKLCWCWCWCQCQGLCMCQCWSWSWCCSHQHGVAVRAGPRRCGMRLCGCV